VLEVGRVCWANRPCILVLITGLEFGLAACCSTGSSLNYKGWCLTDCGMVAWRESALIKFESWKAARPAGCCNLILRLEAC